MIIQNNPDTDLSPAAGQEEELLQQLLDIRADMLRAETLRSADINSIHANYRKSARNLLHYLALRRHELRPLQHRLAALGLSSLGRAESHVLATIDTVADLLYQLTEKGPDTYLQSDECVDFETGQALLAEHTETLLGPPPPGRSVRIMVTMPAEAADDQELVHRLLEQGMNCMRINCAHDDPGTWQRMIENLRMAERKLGRSCKVVMDLAGPKLRTGPLEPGPEILRIRPQRDIYGEVTSPARIWMTMVENPAQVPTYTDACLQLPAKWLAKLRQGDKVKFTDARAAKRTFNIIEVNETGCWAECTKTAYLVPTTIFRHHGHTGGGKKHKIALGNVPATESAIILKPGDILCMTRDQRPGHHASFDSQGQLLTPPRIGCNIPEVFDDVRLGESVWFDDGKIGGVIETIEDTGIYIRVTHAKLRGDRLRADKGINLPESNLSLSALTDKDLNDLIFVAQHADVVEMSFVNSALDIDLLRSHLAKLGNVQPAVVIKVETQRGFENLPEMLLAAMRFPCCGVMIARGDLAVECGFERLAEVQEEILWISEAAHIPVIWATQVLENLAKKGIPSRAEITDAAMGERAECIMLNKGPHILNAVRALDDILSRMQSHQTKKQSMMRELKLAHRLSTRPLTVTD